MECEAEMVKGNKRMQLSPHLMLQRCASILLKNVASVLQIRQYLRHASAVTTLAHYLVDTEPLASALRKVIG